MNEIQDHANRLFNTYFESILNIELKAEEADRLEATIHKNGNECSYTQLSKGQRQVLKLCFGLAVMQMAADQHGISFTQLFFDEVLDGCDDSIKRRAIKMFEDMEGKQIFLVEHSKEIKSMAENLIHVSIDSSGVSHLEAS